MPCLSNILKVFYNDHKSMFIGSPYNALEHKSDGFSLQDGPTCQT